MNCKLIAWYIPCRIGLGQDGGTGSCLRFLLVPPLLAILVEEDGVRLAMSNGYIQFFQ